MLELWLGLIAIGFVGYLLIGLFSGGGRKNW